LTEARLEQRESGLGPATEGWFVLNVADAAWWARDGLGSTCAFETPEVPFPSFGLNLRVLAPGEPASRYHREAAQEDFLVLHGECVLLIEGEERRLRAWDFVHCPPETEHVFVGAGDGPCVVLMVGSRPARPYTYPVSELAQRYGTGVDRETNDPAEAYAASPSYEERRPPGWDALPWA
jgi:uncharacterized cupin superfamily protein